MSRIHHEAFLIKSHSLRYVAHFTAFIVAAMLIVIPVTPAHASNPQCFGAAATSADMVLEFTSSGPFTLELPAQNFTGAVDWGDGDPASSHTPQSGIPTHTYRIGGAIDVCLHGAVSAFGTPADPTDPSYNPWNFHWSGEQELTEVRQWGQLGLTNLGAAFNGASNLCAVADYMIDPVVDMTYMFADATSLGDGCAVNFSHWDTSHVTSVHSMFSGATAFNGDVSSWDVSSVVYMGNMFADAAAFDGDISMWDTSAVVQMPQMFAGATSFNRPINHNVTTGAWDTSHVENMDGMFQDAAAFDQDLNNWDTSSVVEMSNMFNGAAQFGRTLGNVSSWDTSQVGNAFWASGMTGMFTDAAYFNSNIANWDTSNVKDMSAMFAGATRFNRNINYVPASGGAPSAWDTSQVTSMSRMFAAASAFNGNISSWDTSQVRHMNSMFRGATAFNGDVSTWDVAFVGDMESMFEWATSFNQDISGWQTSSLEVSDYMFANAAAFNQNLSGWDVSGVTDMESMFEGATAFNGDVTTWDVSNVDYLGYMFNDATSFNQDLSAWDIGAVTAADWMLSGTAISTLNYSKLLRSWATQPHQSGTAQHPIVLAVNTVQYNGYDTDYYNTVEANRQTLIDDNWFFYDGGSTPAQQSSVSTSPTASAITSGQPVSSSTLTGGMGMPSGTFTFASPSTVLPSGTQSVLVNFTPDDDIAYQSTTVMVPVVVTATPSPSPSANDASASELSTTGIRTGSVELSIGIAFALILLGFILTMRRSRRE